MEIKEILIIIASSISLILGCIHFVYSYLKHKKETHTLDCLKHDFDNLVRGGYYLINKVTGEKIEVENIELVKKEDINKIDIKNIENAIREVLENEKKTSK